MYSEVGYISTLPAEMSEALHGVEFDQFVTEQCHSRKCLEIFSLKPDSQVYFKVLL